MKGGHPNSGPMADPTALRRERDGRGFEVLPAEGRPGPAPEWPLLKPSARELALWASEWGRPQAVMWERNNQLLEVALFVRALAVVEQPGAPIGLQDLLRRQMEALGISAPGLARNRWRIGPSEPAEVVPLRAGPSTRDRFGGRGVVGDAARPDLPVS